MVYDDISAAVGVEEDALATRCVDIVVRAEDERASRWAGSFGQVVAVLVQERASNILATANKHLVFRSGSRAGCSSLTKPRAS